MHLRQTATPLKDIFCYAATNLKSRFARRVTNTITIPERKDQEAIFADEEAMLHEQLMIEQEIMLQQARQSQIQVELHVEQEQKEQAKQAASVPMQRRGEQERILSAQSRQEEKREAITRKLELIRQSLAPKKVDNSAGIANLRAAIAA